MDMKRILILVGIQIIIVFSHKLQIEHTSILCLKCLIEEESFKKCDVVESKNVIHPSCCRKFIDNELEGPLFCGMRCFNHQNKALNASASKTKGRVLWHNHGPNPEINSMTVLIDWLATGDNYN